MVAGIACEPFLLNSSIFRSYLLRKVIQAVGTATGRRIQIANFQLESWPLTAHFYDVTIYPHEDRNDSPFVHVAEVTVRPSMRSLLQHKIDLRDLVIQHPVVNVLLDRGGNVPQLLRTTTNGSSGALNLSIGHVLLNSGEISYRDHKIPLSADLRDLTFEVLFDSQTKLYTGSISYQDARVRYLSYTPARHSLVATFNAGPSHVSINSLSANLGRSTLSMSATIDDFRSPNVAASYALQIHPEDFATVPWSLPLAGDIGLSGKLGYRTSRGRSSLSNLSIEGQLISNRITASVKDSLLEVHGLHGRYELANGSLQVHDAGGQLLAGEASVDLHIQHLDTTPTYQIATSIRGISLQAIQQATRRPEIDRVVLLGKLDGTADAAWTGAIGGAITHGHVVVRSASINTKQPPYYSVPVDAAVHFTYNGLRNEMAFQQTTVGIGSMSLVVAGEMSEHSNLKIDLALPDVRDLAKLMVAWNPGKTTLSELSGSAKLRAVMRGRMQEPRFLGQLTASDLRIHETQWASARGTAQLSASSFVLENASFVNATQGKASLRGSIGLHDWSYVDANPMSLNLSVQRLRVADLLRVANLSYPVSGDLYGDINLHGSRIDPIGEASIRISNAQVFDEPLQRVGLEMFASNGWVRSTVNIGMTAGSSTAKISYAPRSRSYDLHLNVPSLLLRDLHAVRMRNLPLSGVAMLSAAGQGTLDNPELSAVLQVHEAVFHNNMVSPLTCEVHVANKRAELELSSRLRDASVQGRGFVNLFGDYYSEAIIDTTPLQVAHLLDKYLHTSQEGFQAKTEIHATLKGPLKDTDQLESHVTIPAFKATYESFQISTADSVRIDYAHSIATLQPVELRGSDTSIRVAGRVPVNRRSPLTLNAEGYIQVGLLHMVQPSVRSSGILSFDLRTSGSTTNPSLQGQIQLRDVALSTETSPVGLEKINGSLDIENNRLRISSLSGQLGGGELSLTGAVLYWPRLRFDLALQAKAVRLRYPAGIRMLLDSNLAVAGSSKDSFLTGRVLIEEFSFAPEFDIKTLGDSFGNKGMPHQSGLGDSAKLNIAVQSDSNLSAVSSLASVEGNINLQVIGTVENPVIIGRTDLTSGEVFYRSRRYQFERGTVVFSDPNETRPALDVSATTTVQQYNLTLGLRGYLDKLNTSYSSDPPLATADIINLIAVGSTTQGSGTAGHATDSIVASQIAGQINTRMQGLTGISGLQIDPMVGGNNRDPSARIGVQQRLTKNFLFTFSTDVSNAGRETVEGKYQINRRWSIGAARDQVGGIAVDGRYHTRF
jgi:translocation and assembly module TamB